MSAKAVTESRSWLEVFFPPHAPVGTLIAGYTSMTVVITSLLLVLLPNAIISQVWLLKIGRARVKKTMQRMLYLTGKGPFVRFFIWCICKCSFGYLSSQCQTPASFRLRPGSCHEVGVTWTPRLPAHNPFHEEWYVCAWRPGKEKEEDDEYQWQELELRKGSTVDVDANNRWRTFLANLPEGTQVEARLCAVCRKGRGPWTTVAEITTYARPNSVGGFTGPLGPASRGAKKQTYRWGQDKTEVKVWVPIGEDWKTKDLRVKTMPQRLEILYVGGAVAAEAKAESDSSQELLRGRLPKKVQVDEVFWEIETTEEEGRCISMVMKKAEEMEKWPSLLEEPDHPCIDVHLVRFYTQGLNNLDIWE